MTKAELIEGIKAALKANSHEQMSDYRCLVHIRALVRQYEAEQK